MVGVFSPQLTSSSQCPPGHSVSFSTLPSPNAQVFGFNLKKGHFRQAYAFMIDSLTPLLPFILTVSFLTAYHRSTLCPPVLPF